MIKKISLLFLMLIIHNQLKSQMRPGDPDPAFGINGRVITSFPDIEGGKSITGIVIHPTNKNIIAVGNNNPTTLSIIASYEPDGLLNESFGSFRGYTTWPAFTTNAIALQKNLTLVTGGSTGSPNNGMVIRNFLSNGTLVSSFLNNNPFNTSSLNEAFTVATNSQSQIIVAGFFNFLGRRDFALGKASNTGVHDRVFGNFLGLRVTSISDAINTIEQINGITIGSQDKIIAGGTAGIGGQQRFVVARYLNSGPLDTTFGPTSRIPGTVVTDFAPLTGIQAKVDSAQAVTTQIIDGQKKIVAIGYALNKQTQPFERFGFALVRYNEDGSLDTSFGTKAKKTGTGIVVDTFEGYSAKAYALAKDFYDNSIVVGEFKKTAGSNTQFIIASYNKNGVLNTDFGTNGVVIGSFNGQPSFATSVAVDNDNNIVIGGVTGVGMQASFALARYFGNLEPIPNPGTPGSLDPTFGIRGTVATAFPGNSVINGVAIVPSNNSIVAAGTDNSGAGGVIANYLTNGDPNRAFAQGGAFLLDGLINNAVSVHPNTALIVSSGALNVEGMQKRNLYLHALSSDDGTTNALFAANMGNGYHFPPPGSLSEARSISISSFGIPQWPIVSAGYVSPNSLSRHFALTKTFQFGIHDPTFGSGGMVVTNFTNTPQDFSQINGIAIYPASENYKIVVAGQARINGQQRFVLARYGAAGDLDHTFGELVDPENPFGPRTGKVITDFAPITLIARRNDRANAVILQTVHGQIKIVAVGTTPHNNGKPFFALARYNDDGTLDPSFGYPGTGIRINCFGTLGDEAKAVALDANNNIIVAGNAETQLPANKTVQQFIIARYTPDGNVDKSFGINGKVLTPFFGQGAGANAVVLQTVGGKAKIVAGGYALSNGTSFFALARYNT